MSLCGLNHLMWTLLAFLGQGACQAIEGAVILGIHMQEAVRPEDAFRAYEQAKLEKAQWVVNNSWQFGKIAQLENPLLVGLRNGLFRMIPAKSSQKRMEKLELFYHAFKHSSSENFDRMLEFLEWSPTTNYGLFLIFHFTNPALILIPSQYYLYISLRAREFIAVMQHNLFPFLFFFLNFFFH